MAGNPLDKYFDNSALVKYGQVVATVLSSLKVEVEGQVVRLPLEYLGGIRNQEVATKVVSQGLKSTLKFSGFVVDTEAVLNQNINCNFGSSVEKPPLPVELNYEFRLRFKKFVDMARAMEQVVFHFYPHLMINYQGLGRGNETLTLVASSYEMDNDWDGSGEEPSYYNVSFIITVTGGKFYGRNLLEDGDGGNGIIKEVIINYDIYDNQPNTTTDARLFTVYDESVVVPRFRETVPLSFAEGAYSVSEVGSEEPVDIVIGSYNWIRDGY